MDDMDYANFMQARMEWIAGWQEDVPNPDNYNMTKDEAAAAIGEVDQFVAGVDEGAPLSDHPDAEEAPTQRSTGSILPVRPSFRTTREGCSPRSRTGHASAEGLPVTELSQQAIDLTDRHRICIDSLVAGINRLWPPHPLETGAGAGDPKGDGTSPRAIPIIPLHAGVGQSTITREVMTIVVASDEATRFNGDFRNIGTVTDVPNLIKGLLGVEAELVDDFDLLRLDPDERLQVRLDPNNAPSEMVNRFVHQMSFSQFPPPVATKDNRIVDGNTRRKAFGHPRDALRPGAGHPDQLGRGRRRREAASRPAGPDAQQLQRQAAHAP